MKARIKKDGTIEVKAQTIEEAFAINHLISKKEECQECQFPNDLILIDCSILNKKKKKEVKE